MNYNPFLLRHINLDGSCKQVWLFTGIIPQDVDRELKKVVASHNSNKIPGDSKILRGFYGSSWRGLLGLGPARGGDDIPDDIVGDIFSAEPSISEIAKEEAMEASQELDPLSSDTDTDKKLDKEPKPKPKLEPSQKPTQEPTRKPDQEPTRKPDQEPTRKPDQKPTQEPSQKPTRKPDQDQNRYNITIISDAIYPEDRVSEVKLKIYSTTGILPMYQHLFYKFRDQTVPLSYTLNMEAPIRVDILAVNNQTILGIPIDSTIYPNKDMLNIVGYDALTQIGAILRQTGSYDIYMVDLESLLEPIVPALKDILVSDKIQVELLYYGFVVKFYPMITFNVFEQIIKDNNELKTIYPDLVPNKIKTHHAWEIEQSIINKKLEIESANQRDYVDFDKTMSVSVKSANLIVESSLPDITGRVQLDLEKLFQKIQTSEDVPIIKANLYHNKSSITLTKIHTSPDIQKVYDAVRFRLKLPYPGMVLFVLRATDGYLVLVINSTGRYTVRMSWEDEVTVSFEQMYKIVQTNINKFIESINNLGREVFNSSPKLAGIKPSNSKFIDLNINMLWFKSISDSDFRTLETGLELDFKAGIFKQHIQLEPVPNSISFSMYHGMTDTELVDDLGWNTYLYYSDARIKQRWQAIDAGRPVSVIRRATDVRFDMENLSEGEFAYFYAYIKARLFEISKSFKHVKPSLKLEPISAKNRLKLLKERDPQLYKFKRFGSNLVYSRICQKQHQPEIYYQNEYDILPAKKRSAAVKYWNFTQNTPMYYVCPNPSYPHLSFLVGKHPSNFCLPCCKKTIVYDSEISTAKKSDIFTTCVTAHQYQTSDTSAQGSRYIMTYGKILDIGRISYLPGLLDKYLRYNLPDDMIEESGGVVPLEIDGNSGVYNVEQLWKLTKNNKIREIPLADLKDFLEIKSWNYRLTANPGEVQYSPMEILLNPNLSSAHYNRISNVDLSNPILIYRINETKQLMVDGLHRLAKLWLDEKPFAHVRYVTRRQLLKAKIDETLLNRKSLAVDYIKRAGYYIYGVPQNTANADNVGCLYALSVALHMNEDDFIKKVIEKLTKNKGLFNQLLGGNILRYFTDSDDLIQTLERVGSKRFQLGHFEFNQWNELFMDLAKYCFGKYSIVFDDRTVDIAGTSVKHTNDDINLVLPNFIQDSNEIIPSDNQNITKEYILILRKRKKSKNIITNEYYYYPIFIFIPHEFFKTLNIKKRIFMQSDPIIKSIKQIIDDALMENNRIKYEINLNTLEQFILFSKHSINKLWINSSDRAYMAVVDGVDIPIVGSEWHHQNIITESGPAPRSMVHIKDLMQLVRDFNNWVTFISEKAGLIKVIPDESPWLIDKEKSIVPMYPLIKMEKLLILGKSIIGFHSNGLHYYFKPWALSGIKEFVKHNKGMIKSPLALEHIQYDPDIINGNIWSHISNVGSTKQSQLDKVLPKATYNKSLYPAMIQAFMDYFDDDRNHLVRGKLKRIIISTKDVVRVRESIAELDLSESDRDRLDIMLNQYTRHGDRSQLLESINESIFRFDRIGLNKLRDISENYLKSSISDQLKIHTLLVKQLTVIAKHVIKIGNAPNTSKKLTIPADKLKILIDIFAMDLVNPLRREYLLNGIYNASALLRDLRPGPDEQIYIA